MTLTIQFLSAVGYILTTKDDWLRSLFLKVANGFFLAGAWVAVHNGYNLINQF